MAKSGAIKVDILGVKSRFKRTKYKFDTNRAFQSHRLNKYTVTLKVFYEDENYAETKTIEVTATGELDAYRKARDEKEAIEKGNIVTR